MILWFMPAAMSTGAPKACGQGCHGRPQVRRKRAGKVATAVHSRAESVRARLAASALCGSVSTRLTLSRTIHRPRGDSCGMNVPPGHLNAGRSSKGDSPKLPKVLPFSSRNPSVTARSGGVPHGTSVTGEVTATRRLGVLQMSGLRFKVPTSSSDKGVIPPQVVVGSAHLVLR